MNASQVCLHNALKVMVEKIATVLQSYGYRGEPVKMILAGGMAMNYYCGTRYTEDVDAVFSRKILLPYEDLLVNYIREDGSEGFIYFDTNYTPTLSLMHENYEEDIVLYSEAQIEGAPISHNDSVIQLYCLAPIDLALSKIARFSEQDVEDILELARRHYFSADELKAKGLEALGYYIGNIQSVENGIHLICEKIKCDLSDSNNR
ncbi:DUF6036 family nucleotidyltransferase [Crenothrix sp.]|uniref:DUF6036 family nucleotidyltransferase n=1 Tax=Crenothrix sp. TaxID=3100433 RepID=UPI00374D0729